MSDRRRLIIANQKKARLPAEYQEVEYLESTGEQYIPTNIDMTQVAQIKLDVQGTVIQNSDRIILTWTLGNNPKTWVSQSKQSYPYYAFFNTVSSVGTLSRCKILVDVLNQTIYFNDTPYTDLNFNIYSGTKVQLLSKIVSESAKNKTYGFEIIMKNNDYIELIPCYRKSDNVAGMYDLLNNVFYTNQGTGADFIVGANVN